MSGRVVLAALAVLAVVAGTAGAANRVAVQSMSAFPSGDIAVGVYVENDVEVRSVVVPLIIKSVNPNAYMTALTLTNPVPGSRMAGKLPDIVASNTYPVGNAAVSGCNSAWYTDGGGFATIGQPDYISSDGVLLARQRIFGPTLPAGTDFPVGAGIPSFRLNVTVTETDGVFEIDTTCVTPANHLSYNNMSGQQVVPTFTKGTITILPCVCPWQGDINADGFIDAVDLAKQINVTYFGQAETWDPSCTSPRTDYDGDHLSSVNDLVRCIDHVFFGGAGPVDPCE
ncbi:MAG: hypothetical protein AB1752_08515 [Candidatus Zixiibacteriota bacterium]